MLTHPFLPRNPSTFRIFSPDELVSNKLDAVLENSGRNFHGTLLPEQAAVEVSIIIARLRLLMAILVVEILSEHTCQGMLQGYTLTGRTGLFPSYEAFLGIVHTMMVQYAKFAKMVRCMLHYLLALFYIIIPRAAETSWRQDVGSINYLETSTWTRQEHNARFSHQNPSFIGAVLNLKSISARVYLPPDANCFLSTVSIA